MPEKLLSLREAGERLGFRRTKVYELLRSLEANGALRVLRHNKRVVRIREADLDEWIASGCPMTGATHSSAKAS